MEAVFTMWPSPWAVRMGRKARTPWMTPQRFTPNTHCQVDSGPSHGSAGAHDAGVVAHHVDGAEALDGGGGECLHRGLVAHVAHDLEGRHPVGPDALGRLGQRGGIHVGQDHVEAGGGEPLGQGQADSAGRPGHDRDLSAPELHLDPRESRARDGPCPPGSLSGTGEPGR